MSKITDSHTPSIEINKTRYSFANKMGLALLITSVALSALTILAGLLIYKRMVSLPAYFHSIVLKTDAYSFAFGRFVTGIEAMTFTGVELGLGGSAITAMISSVIGSSLFLRKNRAQVASPASIPEPEKKIDEAIEIPKTPQKTPVKSNQIQPEIAEQVSVEAQTDYPPSPRSEASSQQNTPHRLAELLFNKPPKNEKPISNQNETHETSSFSKPSLASILNEIQKPARLNEVDQANLGKKPPLVSSDSHSNLASQLEKNITSKGGSKIIPVPPTDPSADAGWEEEEEEFQKKKSSQPLNSGLNSSLSGISSTSADTPVTATQAIENAKQSKLKPNLCFKCILNSDTPEDELILHFDASGKRAQVATRLREIFQTTSHFESLDQNDLFILKLTAEETEQFKATFYV